MAAKTEHVCTACGHRQVKWTGQCPGCGEWQTMEEVVVESNTGFGKKSQQPVKQATVSSLNTHSPADYPKYSTGSSEFDRVLGDGFVPGSLVMLSASPGSGKSTISSQIIDYLASKGKKVLYMAGEESGSQIRLRVERMGLGSSDKVDITNTIELNSLVELLETGYDFAVIDSLQTIYDQNMSAAAGTPSVLKQIGNVLMRVAKQSNITLLIIGHVTKDGTLAGPNHVQHMVDVVLQMEGEQGSPLRILRANKNRFGSTDEIGIFEMTSEGMIDVTDPNMILLGEHSEPLPGAVICPTLEGTRPVFVEVQALAQPVAFQNAPPARRPRGIDKARFDQLLASLQRHSKMHLSLGSKDIYANVSGGLRVDEPAIDLAVCVAVVSAITGKAVKKDLAVWGEVSLLGEVRPVIGEKKRQTEVVRMGMKSLYKEGNKKPVPLSVLLRKALEDQSVIEDISVQSTKSSLPAPESMPKRSEVRNG